MNPECQLLGESVWVDWMPAAGVRLWVWAPQPEVPATGASGITASSTAVTLLPASMTGAVCAQTSCWGFGLSEKSEGPTAVSGAGHSPCASCQLLLLCLHQTVCAGCAWQTPCWSSWQVGNLWSGWEESSGAPGGQSLCHCSGTHKCLCVLVSLEMWMCLHQGLAAFLSHVGGGGWGICASVVCEALWCAAKGSTDWPVCRSV